MNNIKDYQLTEQDGYTFIDGIIINKCCNNLNPNIEGYIWSKKLKIKVCVNCGEVHFIVRRWLLNIFIFLINYFPDPEVTIVLPEPLTEWHKSALNEKQYKFSNINDQPIYKVFIKSTASFIKQHLKFR